MPKKIKPLTESAFEARVGRVYRLTNACTYIQKQLLNTDLDKGMANELNEQYACYKKAITAGVVDVLKHVEPVIGSVIDNKEILAQL